MRIHPSKTWLRLLRTLLPAFWVASAIAADLPDPDGTAADTSQPVKVFIIMGQSNTLEIGKVSGGDGSLEQAVKSENLYPFMVDEAGNWTERKDVRNVSAMEKRGKMNVYRSTLTPAATAAQKQIPISSVGSSLEGRKGGS